jgi:hypothetical protein
LLIVLTGSNGPLGAAWAHLITSTVFVPISFLVVLRYLKLPARAFVAAVWRVIVAAGLMALVVRALLDWTIAEDWPSPLSLATAIAAGIFAYVAALLALWRVVGKPAGVERTVLGFIAARAAALRRGGPATLAPPRE